MIFLLLKRTDSSKEVHIFPTQIIFCNFHIETLCTLRIFNSIDVAVPAKNSDEIHRSHRETMCEQLKEVHNLLLVKCKIRFGTPQMLRSRSGSVELTHLISVPTAWLPEVVGKGAERGGCPRPSQAFQPPETGKGDTSSSPKKATHLSSTAASHR